MRSTVNGKTIFYFQYFLYGVSAAGIYPFPFKAVRDILNALKSAGVEENTILLFTSDHGDMMYSQGKLRRQKPWDESLLVPLIVHYPKALGTAKRVISMPFSNIDILPTLLGLSGMKIPSTVEGKDYASILNGWEQPTGRRSFAGTIAGAVSRI